MSRGRPPNPNREAAKAAGEKRYDAPHPCAKCGTFTRYVVNCACVQCAVERGNTRYAAMTESQKRKHAAEDHRRYITRKASAPPAANDNIAAAAIPDDFLDSDDDDF